MAGIRAELGALFSPKKSIRAEKNLFAMDSALLGSLRCSSFPPLPRAEFDDAPVPSRSSLIRVSDPLDSTRATPYGRSSNFEGAVRRR
jgi:hypothetical protein